MSNRFTKYNTRFIVATMVIALLGLIGVQIHWISNAMNLSEELFRQQVNEALTNVSRNLERREAVNDAVMVVENSKNSDFPSSVQQSGSIKSKSRPKQTKTQVAFEGDNNTEIDNPEDISMSNRSANNDSRRIEGRALFQTENKEEGPITFSINSDYPNQSTVELIQAEETYPNNVSSVGGGNSQSVNIRSNEGVIYINNKPLRTRKIARVWDSVVQRIRGKVDVDFNQVSQHFNDAQKYFDDNKQQMPKVTTTQSSRLRRGEVITQNTIQNEQQYWNSYSATNYQAGQFSSTGTLQTFKTIKTKPVQRTINQVDNNGNRFLTVYVDPNTYDNILNSPDEAEEAPCQSQQDSEEQPKTLKKTVAKVLNTDRVKNKVDMIQKTVCELGEFTKNLNQRVPEILIDSMIATEFNSKGLPLDYTFSVKNGETNKFIFTSEKFEDKNVSYPYQATLFPSDILQKNHKLIVNFPNKVSYILLNNLGVLFSSMLFVLMIGGGFGWTMRNLVRHKKVSEMKSDFINNMTHEFKTPIATIALAADALRDPDVSTNSDRVGRFIGVIKEENQRLGSQVERVLQAARLERGELALSKTEVNINDIVSNVKDSIALQVDARGGIIHCCMNAEYPFVFADEMHIRNVMLNLIDNANKYTSDEPVISISTRNVEGGVTVSVKDNGIGINKENQKRVFEKLYRVPTGNVHNVKGFGLGLSYAKAIIDAHCGDITVSSEVGEGSEFTVFIPYGNMV